LPFENIPRYWQLHRKIGKPRSIPQISYGKIFQTYYSLWRFPSLGWRFKPNWNEPKLPLEFGGIHQKDGPPVTYESVENSRAKNRFG
jgi:hypothetical protein